MVRHWPYILVFLLGGLLVAFHLSHWLLPVRGPLVPLPRETEWMSSTPAPSPRGYFRHTLRIPLNPEHAWVSVAADDYELYVNGTRVGHNHHTVVPGRPFGFEMSARAQSLASGRGFFNIRPDSTARQRANEEWRVAHFFDVCRFLVPGRNTIAVYVQSDWHNRLAVDGAVSAGPVVVPIPAEASAWRARTEATVRRGLSWYEAAYDDTDWGQARPAGAPAEKDRFAVADPAIWTEPFRAPVVTAPGPPREVIFRTTLPAGLAGQSGWLRVRANWPYELFVGEAPVGGGRRGADGVDAFDITEYLGTAPGQVSVRLYRDETRERSDPTARVPWLAVDGRIGSRRCCTGPAWSWLSSFDARWPAGGGEWQPAKPYSITKPPAQVTFHPPNAGGPDRRWFWWLGRMALGMAGLLAVAAGLLAQCLPRQAPGEGARRFRLACWLLVPALLGVLVQELLRFRFAESDGLLFFLAPANGYVLWLTGPVLFAVSLFLFLGPGRKVAAPPPDLGGALRRVPPWVWLGLIVLVGLAGRLYAIEFTPPTADEHTTWDAARGILRKGVPELTCGVLYTRSPLWHYLLAGWLWLFGDNVISARSLPLVDGVAVIPAVYALVQAITRRPYLGLLTALAVALDPWLLGVANLIRFYQQAQVFTAVSALLFLKGFVWGRSKGYQNLFFLVVTAGVLTQEIFVTTFPAFLLGFLLFYRPFSWKADRNVWVGFAIVMGVTLLDLQTYQIACLTPQVVVSEPLFALHFTDIPGRLTSILPELSLTFFWMDNGLNFFYSVLFFAGALYWLRRPNRAMALLYALLFLTLPTLTVLAVQINARYALMLQPLLMSVAIISADALIRHGVREVGAVAGAASPVGLRWGGLVALVLLAAGVLNADFGRVVDSYHRYRVTDYPRAMSYVAAHRRSGDKVMLVRTPAAAVAFGGLDYYAMPPSVGFDTVYLRKHGVVDRWAGGKLVWKLDQYREVFHRHERVWVVLDEKRTADLDPAVAAFLYGCCRVECEFFGGQVLLWDRKAGRFHAAPDRGGGADSY